MEMTKTQTQAQETVTDTLRNMEVGDRVEFPPSQTDYLRNLISQRMIPERVAGMRWTVNFFLSESVTVVTRTA